MDYNKAIELYLGRTFGEDEIAFTVLIDKTVHFHHWNISDKLQPTQELLEEIIPEVEKLENNERIKYEILLIETNKQPRAIREVALSFDGSVERLTAINAQIAELRAQIV